MHLAPLSPIAKVFIGMYYDLLYKAFVEIVYALDLH